MSRTVALLVALASIVASAGLGAASGPGYFASANVELVAHIPLNYDSAGGRLVGSNFYLTTSRDFRIYDASTPECPRLIGSLPLLQEPEFSEEDLDTNGRITVVEAFGTLNVIDTRDPTAPVIIGQLKGPDYHTVSCVLDCSYAYGSEGQIVDLRNPAAPALVGSWSTGKPAGTAHDVTEVSPGLIVTSSSPIMLLDARTDPVHPTLLAVGTKPDGRFIHANRWPRQATDRMLLVGGETLGPRCDTASAGAFMTWDTSSWRTTGKFTMLDQYRVTGGLPTDGRWPYGEYCAHWFTEHPAFADGGLVAMAWYESGVRFLNVSPQGRISEVGYLIAPGSVASGAYWITDRILYVVDYVRGLDVIRWLG